MGDLPVLLNPLILEKILCHSDHNDLANHRLVCKTWYEVSLTRWRSISTLNILQRPLKPGNRRRLPWKRGVPLAELRNIVTPDLDEESSPSSTNYDFLKLDTKPFSRFRLKRLEFDGRLSPEKFPDFWEKIGPLMTHVHLEQCLFLTPTSMPPDLIEVIFELTPNLEGFKMTRSVYRLRSSRSRSRWIDKNPTMRQKPTLKDFFIDGKLPFRLLPVDLLEYFPNLERFTCHNFHSRSFRITLGELERMEVKLPLKHLDIIHDPDSDKRSFENVMDDIRYGEAVDFGSHVFPLKSLSLGTCSTNLNNFMGAVRKILERYSTEAGGNLEILKLYAAPFEDPEPTLNLPPAMTMESLVELELWGNCVRSLCFLVSMPNLKRLYINTTCFEMWDMMPEIRKETPPYKRMFVKKFNDDMVQHSMILAGCMENFVAENLTDFYVDYEFGVESLKTLTSWMPNLKSHSGILSNETIGVVFEQWKDLRCLKCLYGSKVDDEGITGLRSTSNGESPSKKKIKLETDPLIEKAKEVLNITRLTRLQTFKYEAYCGQGKLSDHSAVEGFLKMEILQTLHICVSPQMTQRMETRLKEAIRNVRIDRNYDEDERDAHEGQCCKRVDFLSCSLPVAMK